MTRRMLTAVPFAAALAVGAGAAGRIYHGPVFALLVAGAAAGATGVGVALLRRPQWTVPLVSTTALIAYAAVVLQWLDPGPDTWTRAVRDGGPRLLTSLVPVEVRPATVLLPIVVVWVAGLVGAEVAVRAGRPAVALSAPVAVYAAALALAGPDGGVQPWRAVTFVALCAGLLAANASPAGAPLASRPGAANDGAPPTSRPGAANAGTPLASRLLAAAPSALAVVLAVVAVAVTVPHRPPDLRAAADPPTTDPLDGNPLARISGWTQDPDRPLFDVDLPLFDVDPPAPARLTLAALGDFDGVTWRIGAAHRPAGRWLPEPPAGGTRVHTRFTVRGLGGRLAPAVAAPVQVRGIAVAYDPDSGSLLSEDALAPGTTYTVTSVVPRPDREAATAGVPGGPEVSRYLEAGDPLPGDLAALARTVAGGEVNPYRKAQTLERFLADHYTYDLGAPGGHAYPNLRFFLLGAQRGTSEQFAAAYAVLGRLMGLPTRVVVGFTGAPGRGTVRGTVRGADALAWPEVLFAGVGWVPFDPMPEPGAEARPLGAYRPGPAPSTASPSTVAPPPVPSTSPPLPVAAPGGSGSGRWPTEAVVAVAAVLALLGAGATAVAARWRLSRRRLLHGDPSDRVTGAWLELLDALRLAGHPAPAGLTVTEVARWAADRADGLPPLDDLADAANRAGFGSAPLTDRDAVVARDQARAYVDARRRTAPAWRRVSWRLHPGPLWWSRAMHGSPPPRARRAGLPLPAGRSAGLRRPHRS
ncbi:transglutaminase domain-containing protein [Virgisporangium ochraceum]|uniref:transglutaminase domain-containing protein n=1 Tax=Virgisporangium ochraceum TaxID=65505 RepID=UPI001EF2B233|nr:transglutaminase domain-containing protein [Virgisporangium ochraceum]